MSMTLALSGALLAFVTTVAPDLSLLAPGERRVFDAVAAEEFCACDSQLTLAGCIRSRPDCRVADHLSRLLLLTAKSGLSSQDILGYFADRVSGPFCAGAKNIDIRGAGVVGPADAPVTLIEFMDFRCGHCKLAAPIVTETLKRYGKKLRWVFMPFPLQDHPLSVAAAEAAMAGEAQGKLKAMHDALFELQDRDYEPAVLRLAAEKAGLDLSRFDREMAARTYASKVDALKKAGLAAGVDGTPAFFVNGRRYEIDNTLFTLPARIEMELDRGKGACQ